MNITEKQKWIEAFEITLKEYKKDIHSTSNCSLCKASLKHCFDCPMNVFVSKGYTTGCNNRKIKIISADSLHTTYNKEKRKKKLKALIEFYTKAIKLLKSTPMREKSYGSETNSIWSKKLKELDKEIAIKYNLIKI